VLNRLGTKQVEAMIEKVTIGKALSAAVIAQIRVKTDGVPLFVEELTKAVLEAEGEGARSTEPLQMIPATLQEALLARLDRLSSARQVVQLGATLGREFSYELLQAVVPLNKVPLDTALAKLVEAEILYQRGVGQHTRYFFKHALIQDTAYQSLLKSTRQQYHRQIAQVLEARFPEIRETQPELLAYHYTEAGLTGRAILYWQKAGERASQHSANMEAISHFRKELALLKNLPETLERTQHELTVQITLGAPLIATKGYAASEVGATFARARELCQQLGQTSQLVPVLWGLFVFYLVRGEIQAAHELAERLLGLAQSSKEPESLLWAHHSAGASTLWLGEFTRAREHQEHGIALYAPQQHQSHAFLYGHDPGMACLSYASIALWLLGFPDQARRRSEEALALARRLAHPNSLAYALDFAALLSQFLREGQRVQELADDAMTLTSEQKIPFWLAWGVMLQGWALGEQGQAEGLVQLRQGLAAYQATGAGVLHMYFLALLAEAYGKQRQPEQGLMLVAEALVETDRTESRFYEAELYRLKGELILQSNGQNSPSLVRNLETEVEECFRKAIEIARRQSAKSLELRAVMSLAKLWQQQQGKVKEAHQLLSEIYGWFTEGFDTKDLQEAKALLEELARNV
jgi:predicted ATPase